MSETQSLIRHVIFDFCGVLIDWSTRAALQGRYDDALVDAICAPDDPYKFFHYEDRMDAGEDYAQIRPDIVREQGEDIARIFDDYVARYSDALPRLMPGMIELLADLRTAGYGVWGLTNWSHETFHIAFEKFPELTKYLQDTIVSGIEKMHKPNADIYELALSRFGISAEESVFVDDTLRNVEGAQAVGMAGIHFQSAEQVRSELQALGVRV